MASTCMSLLAHQQPCSISNSPWPGEFQPLRHYWLLQQLRLLDCSSSTASMGIASCRVRSSKCKDRCSKCSSTGQGRSCRAKQHSKGICRCKLCCSSSSPGEWQAQTGMHAYSVWTLPDRRQHLTKACNNMMLAATSTATAQLQHTPCCLMFTVLCLNSMVCKVQVG